MDTEQDDLSAVHTLARFEQTGSVLGLALDPRRNRLFAAAYYRYDGMRGPGGFGQIYVIDLATGSVAPFAELDVGPEPPSTMLLPAGVVGKTGIGDIDIDESSDTLFVMNLTHRRIERVALGDGRLLAPIATGGQGEPWAANARPFGLGIRAGMLYHGVVDSREEPSLPGALAGYIYRSNLDGSDLTEVARVDLTYDRDSVPWQPWRDAPYESSPWLLDGGQPVLSDIEFRPDGDLILGLRERSIDMGNDLQWYHSPQGDILPTARSGQSWQVLVDARTAYSDQTPPYPHDAVQGMLAADGIRDVVAATSAGVDSRAYRSNPARGGALWFDNVTRYVSSSEPVDSCSPCQPSYAIVLGDLETLCSPSVGEPTASQTATEAQTPSPTPVSASPTVEVTPTVTPTPKATPTKPPRPLYLPLALRESCTPGQRRVDVALVIDASTTMRDDRTAAGRTKLDAAIEAATFFVGTMSLPLDQVAVVVFNETGTVLQPLTGRRADIEAALARIPRLVRQQTRIDLGIEKAHGELTSTRRNPANDPVLILLTDGLANPVPASVAVQRAEEAKADHITMFTIGLGQATALNVVELAQMASRPAYFYLAPDGEDLQAIYRTIAVEIPCPASQHWGGR